MLRWRISCACGVLAIACAVSCSKPKDSPQLAASVTPSALPSASPTASALASAQRLVNGKGACRALLVTGKANAEGKPIDVGTLLDGERWVELETGASVALRHTLTSREFKLIGPGRILPCRAGSEQILIAVGRLSTSANLGVRPGAEVLIATPSGTVRYGDAALDVEFGEKGLRVRVKQGEAWVEPADQSKPAFKNPVHGDGEAQLPARRSDVEALALACQASAQTAYESAERVLGHGANAGEGSLGARAAAHMRDRGAARIACAIAAAAVGAVDDPAKKQSLSASVARGDELWQSVPRAVSGQKN